MKNKIKSNIFKFKNVILVGLVIIVISFMTIGFARYGAIINLSGTINLAPDGKVVVNNVSIVDSSNVTRPSLPVINGKNITFDVGFGGNEDEYYIIYQMDIVNNSSYDYVFNTFDFNPTVQVTGGGETDAYLDYRLENLSSGDVINPGTTRTFRFKLILVPDTNNPNQNYDVGGTTEPDGTTHLTGQILASASPDNINLQGNNDLVPVTVTVVNTYPHDVNFEMISGNGNFILTDENGNSLGTKTLRANRDDNIFNVYVKKVPGAMFQTNSTTMSVILQCVNHGNISTNNITVAVDIYVAPDAEPPHIGTVTLSPSTTDAGNATVTWSRTDQGGTEVQSYHVLIYKSNNTLVKDVTVSPGVNSYEFNDLYDSNYSDGDFYAVVYGIDLRNNGNDYCPATISNEYCRKSSNVTFDWIFNVSNVNGNNNNNYTFNGNNTAILGRQYNATINARGLGGTIDSVSVTMNGRTLTSGTDYTVSGSSYVISKVTGDIVFTISSSCLVKGTKILLANGTYKNIENIGYDDLLSVWNYDTGKITYTYPAFIENSFKVSSYTKTTFSDGSILKTYDSHGIFSYDLNRYILTTDKKYKVGARIVKIVNGKVKVVTIKKIETIYEKTEVYHIVSNGYFNIIANDFLTTDPNIMISNQYGFTDNVKWPLGTRENIINNKDNLYDYSLFSDIMPYYMFKALRVDEGKFVVNQGYISFELLKSYLSSNPSNSYYFKDLPKNNNGKRLLMITTSLDNVNLYNKYKYIYEEGSYYTLPIRNNIKCYMNTTNNTCYGSGSKIKINTSTHFIAIYK